VPITNLGKQREALMGNTEFYKRKVVEYLEVSRGLFPKMDSYIEGILADVVLSEKDDKNEYWLEVKATTISLGNAEFVSELGKYLSAYLIRSPQNRFKIIIAVQDYRDKEYFTNVYHELDEDSIRKLLKFLLTVADENSKKTIQKAEFKDIITFFENTEVIRADSQALQDAVEKRRPKPPMKPKLSDAEYAVKVLDRYRNIKPLDEEDTIVSNLFQLELPKEIWISETPYNSKKEFQKDHQEIILPPIRFINKKAYSFSDISPQSPLGITLRARSFQKTELEKWNDSSENNNIILYLLYEWIRDLCYEKGLAFDDRTEQYFFFDEPSRIYPKRVHWKSQRSNVRDVITPVKREDQTIYYYSHRAVQVAIRSLWGGYFAQLIPGRVFSGDCFTPYPGDISDRLDRVYRKSLFSRNKNQLNDVIFWSQFLFSGKAMPIGSFLGSGKNRKNMIQVSDQVGVSASRKPNAIEKGDDEEEETEEITTSQILDSFLGENEEE
jgi:hypothetical protein